MRQWCLCRHKNVSSPPQLFREDSKGKNCKSLMCKTFNSLVTLWNFPWWAVIAVQTFHLLHTFMSPQWVLNHGISWSPKRPLECLKRPPKVQNFGTQESPMVCPLNHLTLFPSQYSHVFWNKINIWPIYTVGVALGSGQKHHCQNTSEREAFTSRWLLQVLCLR